MGKPSSHEALLLPADDLTQVRFIPRRDFQGQVRIVYRAWDQSQGVPGGTIDPAGDIGGVKSLSRAFEIATLTVQPVNDAPVLLLSGSVDYVRNAGPVTLGPAAAVADVDSPNFAGGQLRVRVASGADPSNRLGIGGGFTVDAGGNVLFGGAAIGQRTSSGFGLEELVIAFNANATPAVAQNLVRAITFRTVGGPIVDRSVLFTLFDGDGGNSLDQDITVNVSAA
jgi:hypothetical protein